MDKKVSESQSLLDVHHGSKEIPNQSWTELYAHAEHWQSDLRFFQDELNFLNTLIDRYLLKLIEEDNMSKITPLTLALSRLEARNRGITESVTKHLRHIRQQVENPFSHDWQSARDEQLSLENDLIEFVKDFRFTKGEIFRSTEQTLKSEKAKHLLAR